MLGAVVALPLALAARLGATFAGLGALLVAALVLAAWALLTRFLHWDGLADAFDGLWGGATRERRLEIMRDSRVGSFGVAAMMMTALVQLAAMALLVERGALWAIVAAPVLARAAASAAAWTLPAARRDGLGLTAMEAPGFYDVTVTAAALLALVALWPLSTWLLWL